MERTGRFFDFKRYAVHDGPGIRFSIFFKGCPLRCAWCHNPESQTLEDQVLFTASKCIGCNTCQGHTLPHLCPSKALETCGMDVSVAEVMRQIDREAPFFDRSGGGVTFTGGEPLFQPQILHQLLTLCGQRGYHRAVDTCLQASAHWVDAILPLTDLFLIDCKAIDPALHQRYTGVDNALIRENTFRVARSGVPFCLRIPFIGGVNDSPQELEALHTHVLALRDLGPLTGVHLLPYHNYGLGKRLRLAAGAPQPQGPAASQPKRSHTTPSQNANTAFSQDPAPSQHQDPAPSLAQDPFYAPAPSVIQREIAWYQAHGVAAQQGG